MILRVASTGSHFIVFHGPFPPQPVARGAINNFLSYPCCHTTPAFGPGIVPSNLSDATPH